MAWVGAVVQAGVGLYQTIAASEAAKNLPEARSYGPTQSLIEAEGMARRRAEEGTSAAERAAFEQRQSRKTSAAERAMRNLGFQGIAQGVSNIFNIDAMNQFSAQSEAERRRGEAQFAAIAGQKQAISDRNVTSFNQMLNQQRTALGQAGASGMKNITGAVGTAVQSYNTNKLAEAYMKSGDTINIGTGTTTPATTTTTPTTTPAITNTSLTPTDGSYLDSQLLGTQASDPFNPIGSIQYQPTQALGGQNPAAPFQLDYQGLNPVDESQFNYFNTMYGTTPAMGGFTDDFGIITG